MHAPHPHNFYAQMLASRFNWFFISYFYLFLYLVHILKNFIFNLDTRDN